MNRKIIFSIILLFSATVAMKAQDEKKTTLKAFNKITFLAWDVNFPMNSDFISKTSFAGGTLGFRKMLNSGNISVGMDLSWNSFYEFAPKKTYQIPDGAVTTDLYKYVYTLPLSLNAHYYFGSAERIHPYAGVAVGATYGDERLYYNTYVTSDDQWGFLARPELGLLFEPKGDGNVMIMLGARYSYSSNKQETFKIENLQSIGVQLGIAWGW